MKTPDFPSKTQAARTSRRRPDAKLLVIDTVRRSLDHAKLSGILGVLSAGDVVVVNDAATLPASLKAELVSASCGVEVRLVAKADSGMEFFAIALGAGTWRQPTETRPSAPIIAKGDLLRFSQDLFAKVVDVDTKFSRLLKIRFDIDRHRFVSEIYKLGQPIQYHYHREELAVWDPQTIFAVAPCAIEAPSAAIHLDWKVVFSLIDHGIDVVRVTHATGISATGDPALDAQLPLPEYFSISQDAAHRIRRAKSLGGRVIAVGTGVTRALESSGPETLQAGSGWTTLKISAQHKLRTVDGILTGMHDAGASHLELMQAFAPRELLAKAYVEAVENGYLWHEFGDLSLILPYGKVA